MDTTHTAMWTRSRKRKTGIKYEVNRQRVSGRRTCAAAQHSTPRRWVLRLSGRVLQDAAILHDDNFKLTFCLSIERCSCVMQS